MYHNTHVILISNFSRSIVKLNFLLTFSFLSYFQATGALNSNNPFLWDLRSLKFNNDPSVINNYEMLSRNN